MLLTIDIGNTHIHIGLFKGGSLIKDWDLPSEPTWDEKKYLSRIKRLSPLVKRAKHCAIASVVPVLTRVFQKVAMNLTGALPIIANAKNTGGLKLKVDNPKEVGADRIVNSLAAYELYGAPAIVIDYGTAITFDLISAKKEYLGGVIAPGMELTAKALHLHTALLPEISLIKPKRIRGTNTKTCIQSGIYYSAVGLTEAIISRLKKELHWPKPKIIMTGGQSTLISPQLFYSHKVDPLLTLRGLWLLAKNHKLI